MLSWVRVCASSRQPTSRSTMPKCRDVVACGCHKEVVFVPTYVEGLEGEWFHEGDVWAFHEDEPPRPKKKVRSAEAIHEDDERYYVARCDKRLAREF